MDEKLERCPFCGGGLVEFGYDIRHSVVVATYKHPIPPFENLNQDLCPLSGLVFDAKRWNTRPLEDALRAERDAAVGMLKLAETRADELLKECVLLRSQIAWRNFQDEKPPILVWVETVDFDGDVRGDYFTEDGRFLSGNKVLFWRYIEYPVELCVTEPSDIEGSSDFNNQ